MPAQLPDLRLRAPLLRGPSVRHEPSDSLPGHSFNEVSPSFQSFISLGRCMDYCTHERPLSDSCILPRCMSGKHTRMLIVQSIVQGLGACSCSCKWTRRRTPGSADDAKNWLYLPTIYPHDSLITLHRATGPQIS